MDGWRRGLRKRKHHMEVNFTLPLPPSVNKMWRSAGKRWYLTKEAVEYKELVKYAVYKAGHIGLSREKPLFNPKELLGIAIIVYPPNNRRMDLDNRAKGLLDALQDAFVYQDDFQIKKIYMEMKPKADVGAVHVRIWSLESE